MIETMPMSFIESNDKGNRHYLYICLHEIKQKIIYSIFQSSIVRFSPSKLMPTFTMGRPQRAKREG